MTTRQLRRAQERKSQKLANKSQSTSPQPTLSSVIAAANTTELIAEPLPSSAQVAANRANAALSTGPKSPEGKAISSRNAVKNALTGKTVLLPTDDLAQYERHIQRFFSEHNPAEGREAELVQALADTQWRLNRVPTMEMAIYALGRIQFKDLFMEEPQSARAALIDAHIFITYQRQLNNLSIQEHRLHRHYQKAATELAALQALRAQDPPKQRKAPQPQPEIGFDFANDFKAPCDLTDSGQFLPEAA